MHTFLKAANNNGDAIAQYQIGSEYKILKNDYTNAIEWLTKAAEQGHVEAYKWANLAATQDKDYISFRDSIKNEMTQEQIAEDQKKASDFYNKQKQRNQEILDSLKN